MKLYRWLGVLHIFIGIGAMAGGLGGMLNPNGEAMGITTDILRNGPFDSFLIPGIILFAFIGVCNVITGNIALRKYKYQAYLSGVMSAGLVVFIVVQCYILWTINILHVIYFMLGIVGIVLATLLAFRQRLFPINIIFKIRKEQ